MATDMSLSDERAMPIQRPSRLARPFSALQRFFAPWRRRALALIVLLAAVCDFYQLQAIGDGNLYYAATVKSMLTSWHNFFFVSFDPGGFVSVDKPPLGFWIQAVSAKLFGFSGFSLLLPEAVAGVLSVIVLYVLVRRVFGVAAGLLAALALAVTPISVVTNRNNTIDSLLVLTVLLAAYAVSRAIERGSLRWLLLVALLVGLGFNIKMLEAYLVVPALAAVYLLGAPLGWWKRLWHLAVAGALLLAVSLSWVLAVDLTPVAARPYVGSSGSNSELALALGYNGLQRLLGNVFRISASVADGAVANGPGGPGGISENGAQGIFRLLNAQLGGQTSWLLALGLVGMLAAGWGLWPRVARATLAGGATLSSPTKGVVEGEIRPFHLGPRASALVLWAGWTLTQVVFFSLAGFFHRYYLSMLAPGIAALAGVGIVLLWRDYSDPDAGWRGWLLPGALVVTALTQAAILADYSGWNAWMTPLIMAGSLAAAGVLVWWRLRELRQSAPRGGTRPFVARLAVALGVAALFVGPLTWTAVSLVRADGTLPAAGPAVALAQDGGGAGGGFGGQFPRGLPQGGPDGLGVRPTGGFPGSFPGASGGPSSFGGRANGGGFGGAPARGSALDQANSQLIAYLEAHQGTATYLFATLSSQTAAPYIVATGKPVMTLGGFSGSDQILTLDQLQALIRAGTVRYFLVSGDGGFGGGPGGGGSNAQLVQWVVAHGTAVPASDYGGVAGGSQLYRVDGAALA